MPLRAQRCTWRKDLPKCRRTLSMLSTMLLSAPSRERSCNFFSNKSKDFTSAGVRISPALIFFRIS